MVETLRKDLLDVNLDFSPFVHSIKAGEDRKILRFFKHFTGRKGGSKEEVRQMRGA